MNMPENIVCASSTAQMTGDDAAMSLHASVLSLHASVIAY
jgi:hypothetical protein